MSSIYGKSTICSTCAAIWFLFRASGVVAGVVKNSPGSVMGFTLNNKGGAADTYLQIFNKTINPVAGDVPVVSLRAFKDTFGLLEGSCIWGHAGIKFDTGIAFGVSITDSVYTAAGTAAAYTVQISWI